MEATADPDEVADLFADLGISRVPAGDGYEEVKRKHRRDDRGRFEGADSVSEGPLQLMMNNERFRADLGRSFESRDLRYLPFDEQLTIRRDGTWNARELVGKMKRLLLDLVDSPGFYLTVSYGRVAPEDPDPNVADEIHWIGIEFRRGSGPERATLYDPGRCGEDLRVWAGADPIAFGLMLSILSDPEVARALDWEVMPTDSWGSLGSRGEAIGRADEMILSGRDTNMPLGLQLQRILKSLGLAVFNPVETPCQTDVDDYFCQSWVLYLFEQRAKFGKSRSDIERTVDALWDDERALRKLVLDFTIRVIESDVAREYWTSRFVRREPGVVTSGADFYRWLLYAVHHPDYGADYLDARCNVNMRGRGSEPRDVVPL